MTKVTPAPLQGLRVLEFAGIGPVPFCGMWLADMGADVVRVDKPDTPDSGNSDLQGRGKRSIKLDLKGKADSQTARSLMAQANVVLEGFRPGVMERLGLGPEVVQAENPKLVYGRMTGWGQDGPQSQRAGHDINYIAMAGALHAMGDKTQPPIPPLNLLGDYGGGAMMLCSGILAALLQAERTGKGSMVDAAIVDGVAYLMTPIYWLQAMGMWQNARGANILDGAAHFYRCYTCQDGKFISVGAIEPQFYNMLCDKLDLSADFRSTQHNQDKWPEFSKTLADIFATKPQLHWVELFEGTDACVAAVEDMRSMQANPHMQARAVMRKGAGGILQPAPAPRYDGAVAAFGAPPTPGADREGILNDWLRG